MVGRQLAAALAAVVLLGACGGDEPGAAAAEVVVGIAMPATTPERWISDGDNMVERFEAAGYRADLQYAGDDVGTQIRQLDEMIDEGVDVLVVTPIDADALDGVLRRANRAGVPVISYDRLVLDSPDVTYYATFDNVEVGVLQGSHIRDTLRLGEAGGPFQIEVFAGAPDDNNSRYVLGGAMSVLQPFLDEGVLQVRSGETALEAVATTRWDGDVARARMTRLLAEHHPDGGLDAVLSPNDSVSAGIIAALRDAGYGEAGRPMPVVTGQDAEVGAVRAIIAGEQSQTVFKDTRRLADVAAGMVQAVLEGREPEVNDMSTYDNGDKVVPTYLVEPVSVHRDNYEEVLLGSGYYTREQLTG